MSHLSAHHLAFFLVVCAIPPPLARATPFLPPFPAPDQIRAGELTSPPQVTPEGLLLPIRFTAAADRVYWDIPLSARIPKDTTALDLVLSCPDATPIRGLSIHLQSGDGWYNASADLSAAPRQRLTLPRGLFQSEGSPGPWEKSSLLRISAWRKTDGSATLILHSANARADRVAIARATATTAPGETAFAAALCNRCARLLTKAGIPFAVIDDSFDNLDAYALVLLPYAPTLPDQQLARLTRFANQNGKLIVFYNASAKLAALLGVRPGTWQGTAPGQEWSALVCDTSQLPGTPARVPHVTNSIIPPAPLPGNDARTVATWADDTGRVTDLPACVLSRRAAWFAHIPPLAYPSAAALLRTLAHSLCPDLDLVPVAQQPLIPLPPPSSPSEIRAAWNTSPTARHPRGWNGLLPQLAARSINTLFVHWQSAGTALYEPPSARPADTLADALAAGTRHGVALHAWATCWTLEGADPSQTTRLTREGRLMRDASGSPLPWLCPSIPENRALVIDALRVLARSGVAGIHLDYVRYPENTGCYAPATRQAFELTLGHPVAAWPADVQHHGPHADAFATFRCNTMTRFLRETRSALRGINPEVRLSAAVFPTPSAAVSCGQDWPAWLREGLIDFACPMIYTEKISDFTSQLDQCLAVAPASALVPGLGTGADACQLDAPSAALQIAAIRTRSLAGFAFFAVDDELISVILPALFP